MAMARRSGLLPDTTDVAIVGAGPYGLSIAAHLRASPVDFRIFGEPMIFWRRMLPSLHLKSPDFGSNIYTPEPGNTFIEWADARGLSRQEPIPMSRFTEYGLDTQRRILPMVEPVHVTRVRPQGSGFEVGLADGSCFHARRVVVAVGLAYFAQVPAPLAHLPPDLVTHTSRHATYDGWNGRRVIVIGTGQSALESAAALRESGAAVTLVFRKAAPYFTPTPSGRERSLWQRIRRPRTVLGEGPLNYSLQTFPAWPHFLLPERLRVALTKKHLGPYGTWWLRKSLEGHVAFVSKSTIVGARAHGAGVELRVRDASGKERSLVADHIVCGTGYATDVERLPFLEPELTRRIARIGRAPRLSFQFESSVPGLYFVGQAASFSFGPILRFVCGAEYTAPAVARYLEASLSRVPRRAAFRAVDHGTFPVAR
ncbi:MAG TPA: NAD(P)-binding domain-containing protein [Polyangiaceae bacterium]|nr:NAD(P)-binding domain-containing protein [Polyangiaceae bacterium]